MRFGYFFMPLHQPEEDPTLGIESDLRTVELAEELGYDEILDRGAPHRGMGDNSVA